MNKLIGYGVGKRNGEIEEIQIMYIYNSLYITVTENLEIIKIFDANKYKAELFHLVKDDDISNEKFNEVLKELDIKNMTEGEFSKEIIKK